MSDSVHTAPKASEFWLSFWAVLGTFGLFAIILAIVYWPRRPPPLAEGVRSPAERAALLAETQAAQQRAATEYGWVDQPQGVVRLPVERAMKLVVEEQRSRQQPARP
jgi:hypothetical protein